jgi:hypothetical protein
MDIRFDSTEVVDLVLPIKASVEDIYLVHHFIFSSFLQAQKVFFLFIQLYNIRIHRDLYPH